MYGVQIIKNQKVPVLSPILDTYHTHHLAIGRQNNFGM